MMDESRIGLLHVTNGDAAATPTAEALPGAILSWRDVGRVDRWHGGLQLGDGRPDWRWDPVAGRLVRSG